MKTFSHFRYTLATLLLASFGAAQAQGYQPDPEAYGYYQDALRFSQTKFGGSARTLGLAGAVSAVGADIGSVSVNPAGLGLYTKSEFTGSIGAGFAGSETDYNGKLLRDNKASMSLPNLGIVFANPIDPIVPGSWRGGAFAITLTRNNNFQNKYSYDGTSILQKKNDEYVNNSIIDYYADLMQNRSSSVLNIPKEERSYEEDLINLAYDTYIADVDTSTKEVYPLIPRGDLRQSGTITTRGRQSQWDFAYGGNIDDKLYLGASVGVAMLSYKRESLYKERITKVANPDFNAYNGFTFQVVDKLELSGTGVNFKVGMIYRPNDWVRIGASVQTPTFYALNETNETSMTANFNGIRYGNTTLGTETATGVTQKFDYSLRTPLKATGGIAIFMKKAGFISVDAEYVTYNTAMLSVKNDNLAGDNRTISNLYKPTLNLRAGAEFRHDIYRMRGGVAYYGDPYSSNADKGGVKRDQLFITAGVGVRKENHYFDVALVTNKFENTFQPHRYIDPIAVRSNYTNVVFTFGTFF
jgi:long-subunit fatty acid transport protein